MWSLPVDLEKPPMSVLTDPEIQKIVHRVLSQVMGTSAKPMKAAEVPPMPALAQPAAKESTPSAKTVALGADHGGFELKEILKIDLSAKGFEVLDQGTLSQDAVDYPDFAHKVAKLVGSGQAWRGIVIDGAGIGSCIVANKVPGVRAGMAYDYSSALNGREHNDTNVLTLGAGLIGVNLAKQIVQTWLTTPYAAGRHARRVNKIMAIEKEHLK
jgi:ribose 5-phosphate isomerase B